MVVSAIPQDLSSLDVLWWFKHVKALLSELTAGTAQIYEASYIPGGSGSNLTMPNDPLFCK